MSRLKHIWIFLVLAGIFSSCSDDDLLGIKGDSSDELPIEFKFMMPEAQEETRVIEKPKRTFVAGDVIHIQATFQTEYEGAKATVIRYGALRKKSSAGWEAVDGSKLTWPTTATSGTFIAYWIAGSDGVLYVDESPLITNLSDLTPQTDPLTATSPDNVPYGHAVEMQFKHLCTYLTLMELEPQVSNSYWITRDAGETFHNAFSLSVNDNNNLEFQFISVPDPNYQGLVYVAGDAINIEQTDNATGAINTITMANYFLEPGDYETFTLRYPGTQPDSYEYLKYDFSSIPSDEAGEGESNIVPTLEAGNTYMLNVTKSPGVTIVAPPDVEGWDESENYYEVNVEDFLKAVFDGDNYSNSNGTLILQKTATGTLLLHNIDFNFEEYNGIFDAFQANVNEGQTFDGGLHYIKNIGSPVFRNNNGTIKNIGLKYVNATFVTDENDESNHDMSRKGLLVCWNQDTGVIENVRITGETNTITAYVNPGDGTENEGGGGATQETHNIGCVLGSNTGTVNGVELGGTFNVTVDGYPTLAGTASQVNVTVDIGGIVGQNAGLGYISNITTIEGSPLAINIYNKCRGNSGAFYVGGIAGYCSAYLNTITLTNVKVDCTLSQGVVQYNGGIAGELTSSSAEGGVRYCNVSGSVSSGVSSPFGTLESACYTGGISGALMSIPVTGCNVTVAVAGPVQSVDAVLYATGGAFGRIRTATPITNISAWGATLTGPNQFIGNFAGIVPAGLSWEANYAGNNITVRQFGFSNIGGNLTY